MNTTSSESATMRKPWVAKMLTHLAPGLGHLYCGRVKEALTIYFAGSVLIPIMLTAIVVGSASIVSWVLLGSLLAGLVIWIYASRDIRRVAEAASQESYTNRPFNRWWIYLLIGIQPLGFIIPISLLVRSHLVEAFVIAGQSMSPNLVKGDRVLVDKRRSGQFAVQRGDVVVFRCPGKRSKNFVKRVVGLPGEQIEIDAQSRVSIDGKLVGWQDGSPFKNAEEGISYHFETTSNGGYTIQLEAKSAGPSETVKLTVPADHVFVLGDNRSKSRDSRHFGTVPIGDVLGPVSFLYQPAQSWPRFGRFQHRATNSP